MRTTSAPCNELFASGCCEWPERHGYLSAETVAELKHWDHGGGFSVHAGVLIEAEDRAALERLLRYCARPAFASERLEWESEGSDGTHAVHSGEPRVRYTLPKPGRDGQTVLVLTPLEFLDRVAALIPPPRRHRHQYHGAFAPHAALRTLVTAYAGKAVPGANDADSLPLVLMVYLMVLKFRDFRKLLGKQHHRETM